MNEIRLSSSEYNLIIEESVISKLNSFEQTEDKPESGGILLGKVAVNDEATTIVITDITIPCHVDFRARFRFIRRKGPAQTVINKKWEVSNGKVNYLGEWHTHPEYDPVPSSYDERMIKKTNNRVKSDFDFTLLLIVGTKNTLWVGVRNKEKLVSLNLVIR